MLIETFQNSVSRPTETTDIPMHAITGLTAIRYCGVQNQVSHLPKILGNLLFDGVICLFETGIPIGPAPKEFRQSVSILSVFSLNPEEVACGVGNRHTLV